MNPLTPSLVMPLSADRISPSEARERLAECLYLKMERMDPERGVAWRELQEPERDFYRASIREILLETTLLNLASQGSSDSPTTM